MLNEKAHSGQERGLTCCNADPIHAINSESVDTSSSWSPISLPAYFSDVANHGPDIDQVTDYYFFSSTPRRHDGLDGLTAQRSARMDGPYALTFFTNAARSLGSALGKHVPHRSWAGCPVGSWPDIPAHFGRRRGIRSAPRQRGCLQRGTNSASSVPIQELELPSTGALGDIMVA